MTKAESFMVMVVRAVDVESGAVRKDIRAGRFVWVVGNRRLYILFPSLNTPWFTCLPVGFTVIHQNPRSTPMQARCP